jgi:hypothetical protein
MVKAIHTEVMLPSPLPLMITSAKEVNATRVSSTEGMTTEPVVVVDDGLLSPTSKQRYRAGMLQHKCGVGFFKGASIKTKYFRLRGHGLMGYPAQDETVASLEILFTLATNVEPIAPMSFLLRNVSINQSASWLFKVEDPVTFKTNSSLEMEQWVADIQAKLDSMKRQNDRKRSIVPTHNAGMI